MKYRKKPVIVEATQWDGDANKIFNFVGDSLIVMEMVTVQQILKGITLKLKH